MFETTLLPVGPDVHLFRSDVDAYLVSRLDRYGIDYRDHAQIESYEPHGSGMRMTINSPEGRKEVTASFVVDASGHSSFLAKRYGLRRAETDLVTNTRSVFGHFKSVPDLDSVLGGYNQNFRFHRTAGTVHHFFKGGWIWVIPFNNEITSVGLQLDRTIYPLDTSITPEQEFKNLFNRFPSIQAALGSMEPVRPYTRTDRLQFSSTGLTGPGFILTPHAAGFVGPLFSTGILFTGAWIGRFLRLVEDRDFSPEKFEGLERTFFTELRHVDHLAWNLIRASRDLLVFKQAWRSWAFASNIQFATQCVFPECPDGPMLYGAGLPGFRDVIETISQLLDQESDNQVLAKKLHELLEPWEELGAYSGVFERLGSWTQDTSDSVSFYNFGTGMDMPKWLRMIAQQYPESKDSADARVKDRLGQFEQQFEDFTRQYRESKQEGTDFHRHIDEILAQRAPDFDYRGIPAILAS